MKKLLIILAFSVVTFSQVRAQYSCLPPSSQQMSFLNFCGNLVDYMPANATDTIKFPVNFIFFTPDGINGKWDTVTPGTCRSILNRINARWRNLRPTWNPIPGNPAPFWSNTQIQFTFKSITHKVDAQYASHKGFATYTPVDLSAINIVFNVDSPTACVGNCGYFSNLVVASVHPNSMTLFNIYDPAYMDMLSHELGHNFGLIHTWVKLGLNSPANINPPLVSAQAYVYPDPPIDDYWLEGISSWGEVLPIPNDTVMNIGDIVQHTNNIMGYNWGSRTYFSPEQIQMMHLAIKTAPNLASVAGRCNPGAPQYLITGTYANLMFPDGDLIIQSGEHVIITGCVYMKQNTSIIVEPGGKLSLIGAKITKACPQQWKGIEVWSDPGAGQVLSYPNPNFQTLKVGIVELDNATVEHAETGVRIGKFASNGSFISQTGAGVILSNNSLYKNNKIGVWFNDFFVGGKVGSPTTNLSYFHEDVFICDANYAGSTKQLYGIKVYHSNKINIMGCRFEDETNTPMTGINISNGSVIVKNYRQPGYVARNEFKGLFYGIATVGWLVNNSQSIVDSANFDQFSNVNTPKNAGCIYGQNTNAFTIVDCDFHLYPKPTPANYKFGVFLDNCDGYVIENNEFVGVNGAPNRTSGIIIHNCGLNVNQVYNNTFKYVDQGIWAQNINYDINTGLGLRMTCNDFTDTRFNIGVQSTSNPGIFCSGCPPGTQFAGVAQVQGLANAGASNLVRNVYGTYQTCTAENRYYIKTGNVFKITGHGSFNTPSHWPAPQPICSDSNEVNFQKDPSSAPFGGKSNFCNANVYNNLTKPSLDDNISTIRADISSQTITFSQKLDGGSTVFLLNLIPTSLNRQQLRDTLVGKHFLSDTVLISYLDLVGNDSALFNRVFIKNSPVSSRVWEKILTNAFHPNTMTLYDSLQTQHKLSAREFALSLIRLAKSERGLLYNEKIRRFLSDSIIQFDSIKTLYDLGEIPNSDLKLFDLALTTANYEAAENTLDYLIDNHLYPELTPALSKIYLLETDTSYFETLKTDTSFHSYLLAHMNSNDPYREGYFKSLLSIVYDDNLGEIVLEADLTVAKLVREENEVTNINDLTDEKNISIYPNPTSDFLIVKSNSDRKFELIITNVNGLQMISTNCENDCKINIGHLANGIYFVNLFEGKKRVGNGKLVVIR